LKNSFSCIVLRLLDYDKNSLYTGKFHIINRDDLGDMVDECSSTESCKEAALDRFKDAFALYEKERYLAVVYMCGYVIELGIKSEFHKLKDFRLDNDKMSGKASDIICYLLKDRYSSNELPEWMKNFTFPSTLFEFVNLIKNIADEDKKGDKKSAKLLSNQISELNSFSVILSNRILPSKVGHSTFHNISDFLEELNRWKEKLGDKTFLVEDYQIDEKLGWGVNLRYTGSVNTMNDKEAKEALLMSLKFCEEILLCDVSRFKNALNPKNNDQSDTNIKRGY